MQAVADGGGVDVTPDMPGLDGGGFPDNASDGEPAYRSGACIGATSHSKVSFDDTTLGYSGREVAEGFAKNGAGILQWFDGAQTILHITADASQATVTIWDSPPYQGHCYRFMTLDNVSFTVTTDDGRLNLTVVNQLVADDAGGPIVSIWPELGVALDENRGSLQLPADWRLPEQNRWSLRFVVNSRVNLESPYCLVDEPRDVEPASDCTAWSGKIIYAGAKMDMSTMDAYVVQLVGQWMWQ